MAQESVNSPEKSIESSRVETEETLNAEQEMDDTAASSAPSQTVKKMEVDDFPYTVAQIGARSRLRKRHNRRQQRSADVAQHAALFVAMLAISLGLESAQPNRDIVWSWYVGLGWGCFLLVHLLVVLWRARKPLKKL